MCTRKSWEVRRRSGSPSQEGIQQKKAARLCGAAWSASTHLKARALYSFQRLCLLLHRQRKLERLLLAPLDDLFPELSLMLHALELRLDVLLRDLEKAQHAVVSLLGDHVQD